MYYLAKQASNDAWDCDGCGSCSPVLVAEHQPANEVGYNVFMDNSCLQHLREALKLG